MTTEDQIDRLQTEIRRIMEDLRHLAGDMARTPQAFRQPMYSSARALMEERDRLKRHLALAYQARDSA